MSKSDYDFSEFLDKDNPNKNKKGKIKDPKASPVPGLKPGEEDPRENLRIIRCCGNCKNFWWHQTKGTRRGFCLLPDPEKKRPNKKKGESYDIDYIKNNYLRVHITNVCDHHELRSQRRSIDFVARWVGVPFAPDQIPKKE